MGLLKVWFNTPMFGLAGGKKGGKLREAA